MTRMVRVKIDLCLEFDRDLTSLPIDGHEGAALVLGGLALTFSKVPGVVAIASPWSFSFGLDTRTASRAEDKRVRVPPRYYVISLNHTRRDDGLIALWGPNNSSYQYRLEQAGRYTESQVRDNAAYYNDGQNTLAVRCDVLERLAIPAEKSRSRVLSRGRPGTERVVPYRHLRRLIRQDKGASGSGRN